MQTSEDLQWLTLSCMVTSPSVHASGSGASSCSTCSCCSWQHLSEPARRDVHTCLLFGSGDAAGRGPLRLSAGGQPQGPLVQCWAEREVRLLDA